MAKFKNTKKQEAPIMVDFEEKKEKYSKLLVENSLDLISLLSLTGKIIFITPSVEKMTGYKQKELIGKSIFDFMNPADIKIAKESIARAVKKPGWCEATQLRIKHKNGSWVTLESRGIVSMSFSGVSIIVNSRDVSEQIESTNQLIKEKDWHEALINLAPNIIVGLKEEAEIVLFNKFAEDLTGYKAEDVIGKKWTEIFIPKSIQKEIYSVFNTVVEKKFIQHHYENLIITKKGEEKIISWNNTVLTENGKFKLVLSIGEDITDRRSAEKRLQESEKRLNDLMSTIADWTWEINVKGQYTYSSPKGFEYFGRDLLGKMPSDYVSKDEIKKIEQYFSEISAKKTPFKDLETWHTLKNGEKICFLTSGLPILNDRGNLKGFRGVSRDITERKNLEALVLAEKEEQQTMLDSIPAWVFYKDDKNNFIHVNGAVADAMDMTKNQLEGKSLFDIYPKNQAQGYFNDDKEVIASGKPKNNILEEMSTPKGVRLLQVDKVPYKNGKGEIIGVIGFAIDITESKKVEDVKNEKMEELEKFKELMVGRELKMIEFKEKIADLEARLVVKTSEQVNLQNNEDRINKPKNNGEIIP
jgi:PAS domain S-box-containing protein